MRNHIFKHQSFITIFLTTIFVCLIVIQIAYPNITIDIPFSLVAGWLGIVIGFFFNQQIAEFFQKKYRKTEEQKRHISEEIEKRMRKLRETDEKTHEKYRELQKIKELQEK